MGNFWGLRKFGSAMIPWDSETIPGVKQEWRIRNRLFLQQLSSANCCLSTPVETNSLVGLTSQCPVGLITELCRDHTGCCHHWWTLTCALSKQKGREIFKNLVACLWPQSYPAWLPPLPGPRLFQHWDFYLCSSKKRLLWAQIASLIAASSHSWLNPISQSLKTLNSFFLFSVGTLWSCLVWKLLPHPYPLFTLSPSIWWHETAWLINRT